MNELKDKNVIVDIKDVSKISILRIGNQNDILIHWRKWDTRENSLGRTMRIKDVLIEENVISEIFEIEDK